MITRGSRRKALATSAIARRSMGLPRCRVMAMTDAEKSEMPQVDDFARRILERTESLGPEHFMKMHGARAILRPRQEEFRGSPAARECFHRGIFHKGW